MDYRSLYQAVEKSETLPIKPCFCSQNAWLSQGYYFWDTYIENAHWWGEVHYQNNYMIGETACDKNSKYLYDLVGDLDKRKEFFKIKDILNEKRGKEVLVEDVILFLRRLPEFIYKAIRVNPYNSKRTSGEVTIRFSANHKAFMPISEPYQLCVFDLSFLEKPFEIIYPQRKTE